MTRPVGIEVRQAGDDDVPVLSALYNEGQAGIDGARGAEIDTMLHGRGDPATTSFEAELAADSEQTFVALIDGVVIGYLSLDLSTAAGRLGTVTDLYVQPGARGVGAGASLLDAAVAAASSAGCTGLNARALPGDRPTKNFFESFGLVARSIEVHRSLG